MKEEKEVSFFKKLIISIKDFERYPELASKNKSVVLSYLIKLLAIFVIVVSFTSVYNLSKEVNIGLNFIKEELPDFKFANNKLEIKDNQTTIKENMDMLFDTVIVDTNQIEEQTLNTYKEKLIKSKNGVIILNDKAFIKTENFDNTIEYPYTNIVENYQINEFDKDKVLEYFSSTNLILIYLGVFAITFIFMFLLYFVTVFIDVILFATLGFFTAIMLRIHLRFSAMCKIVIHSLTLPILLNAIINLVETFTTFRVEYFEIMYIGISYIYVITAILMIKSDIIKNQKELTKILEEQARVREELARKKEEEEDQKQEEKRKKEKEERSKKEKKEQKEKEKDKELGNEPQGENA